MRIMPLLATVAISTALLACKPPPKEQTVKVFQKEIHLYFQNIFCTDLLRLSKHPFFKTR